jgi:hypothetical protein
MDADTHEDRPYPRVSNLGSVKSTGTQISSSMHLRSRIYLALPSSCRSRRIDDRQTTSSTGAGAFEIKHST